LVPGGSGVDFTAGSLFIIQVSIIARSLLYVSLDILEDRIQAIPSILKLKIALFHSSSQALLVSLYDSPPRWFFVQPTSKLVIVANHHAQV
jgi:hypothetical protein